MGLRRDGLQADMASITLRTPTAFAISRAHLMKLNGRLSKRGLSCSATMPSKIGAGNGWRSRPVKHCRTAFALCRIR